MSLSQTRLVLLFFFSVSEYILDKHFCLCLYFEHNLFESRWIYGSVDGNYVLALSFTGDLPKFKRFCVKLLSTALCRSKGVFTNTDDVAVDILRAVPS